MATSRRTPGGTRLLIPENRLGELIMIRKLHQGNESPALPPAADSPVTESFDKLDLGSSSSAMSMALDGAADDSSNRNSKRSSSRSPSRLPRTSSSTSVRDFFHRRATSSSQTTTTTTTTTASTSASASASASAPEKSEKEKHEDHLVRWLRSGNVIYKSVGLGLMDLVVGMEVVRLARVKGIGNLVENFSSSSSS